MGGHVLVRCPFLNRSMLVGYSGFQSVRQFVSAFPWRLENKNWYEVIYDGGIDMITFKTYILVKWKYQRESNPGFQSVI